MVARYRAEDDPYDVGAGAGEQLPLRPRRGRRAAQSALEEGLPGWSAEPAPRAWEPAPQVPHGLGPQFPAPPVGPPADTGLETVELSAVPEGEPGAAGVHQAGTYSAPAPLAPLGSAPLSRAEARQAEARRVLAGRGARPAETRRGGPRRARSGPSSLVPGAAASAVLAVAVAAAVLTTPDPAVSGQGAASGASVSTPAEVGAPQAPGEQSGPAEGSATPGTAGATTAQDAPAVPSAEAPSSTSAPASPTEPAASVASREDAPVGDLPGWRQVFVEGFSEEAPLGEFPEVYGDRWTGYEGAVDTSGAGLYAESRVASVEDGVLDLHLRTEDGQALVAAPAPLVDGAETGMVHGKFSVRFRADPVPGYRSTWVLWPDSNDWEEGEIDFPTGSLDSTILGATCSVGPSPDCVSVDTGEPFEEWHTASVEWTADSVTYLLDGEVVGTSDQVPSTPMHWVLQAETDGEAPDPAASGHVQVDWVAVYAAE